MIVPHLWFDKEAQEAAEFYASIFPNSKVMSGTILHDTPSGDANIVSFQLWGQKFMAISAGPYFTFNPSLSFMVNFDPSLDSDASEKINEAWTKLSGGGTVLMPLDKYPFSERYGWIQDKYGLTWQLILTNPAGEERSAIIPSLMFVGDNCGKAEEALNFYLSVFKNSKQGHIARYPQGMEPDKKVPLCFLSSCWRINGLPQWTVHTRMSLVLMRQLHLWCTVTHKKRLIITGISFLLFLSLSNADG